MTYGVHAMATLARCSCILVVVYMSLVVAGDAGADDSTTGSRSNILAPNVSTCLPPLLVPEEELQSGLHCCPPAAGYSPRLFRPSRGPQSAHEPLRVRRPAHEADQAEAQRLARAYTLMRALPPDDPRSFMQQANIHCAYCNSVYLQQNSSTQRFQVHGCWLFYPFHRWYLYFHERILAKLLREDGEEEEGDRIRPFALPFWNYDHPGGSTIPWLFAQVPELRDARRNPLHAPPAIVALDVNPSSDGIPPEIQLRENAHLVHRTIIRDADTQTKFFGKPYRQGDSPMPGSPSIEEEPHGTVHIWTGDYTQVGWKDMGAFYATARDPIFYAHHAELDRLWEVWCSFEGNHNLRDKAFLSTEFVFYDENAELVRVRVGDSLDTKALGYVYQEVDLPWKDSVPIRQSRGVARLTPNDTLCTLGGPIEKPCSVVLQRDPRMNHHSTAKRESLVINGTTWPDGFQSFFTIYLNLPSANNETTMGCTEYVGALRALDHRFQNLPANAKPSASYDISSRVRDLRLTRQDRIVVTLVPKFGSTDGPSAPATISGPIAVQYLNP